MSELDEELRGLREELSSAIPVPDVDHLTARARVRRKLQVGAIAAVVAVVAAVPVARALPVWLRSADPVTAGTGYAVDFADADHGYALTRSCAQGSVGCTFTLFRTADGGETWQPRRLPPAPDDGFWDVMYVLGPDAVTLANPLGVEQTRIFSVDGGRSWGVTRDMSPVGTAPLPSGGVLTAGCGTQPYGGEGCALVGTLEPASGRFVAAPAQPQLAVLQVGTAPTEGGKWWVAGAVDGNAHAFLAVSADGGRTWSSSEMGEFAGAGGWAVVEHGNVMYATASRSGRVFGVWRSTTGGRSWTRVWTAPAVFVAENSAETEEAAPAGPGLLGDPVVADDGSLVLSDTTTTHVSHDRGRTFRPVHPASVPARWTRAGYLRIQGQTYGLSSDGAHWREFTVG